MKGEVKRGGGEVMGLSLHVIVHVDVCMYTPAYAYAYARACACTYCMRMHVCMCVCIAHEEVIHAGVACVLCHVMCQVSAGTVSETVLQTCVRVTVIKVTCMEG